MVQEWKETDRLLKENDSFERTEDGCTLSVKSVDEKTGKDSGETIKVYTRRWYILGVYTFMVVLSTLYVNTFPPIQGPVKEIFRWKDWNLLLFNSVSTISLISASAPFGWLVVTKGLRPAVVLSAGFLFAGKVLQCLPFISIKADTLLMNVGQAVSCLSFPIAFGAPTFISSTWFPPEERTTATAIGTLAFSVGMAMGFLIGPAIVPYSPKTMHNSTSVFNHSSNVDIHLEKMRDDFKELMYLQAALGFALFVAVLGYFPNKPPLAPSRSATKKNNQPGFKTSLILLLTNKSFWLLAILFAAEFGVTIGWQSVMDVVLSKFNINQKDASWLGCAGSLAGIVSGVLISRIADCYQRSTKALLIFLFAMSGIFLLIFSLSCQGVIPFNLWAIFVTYNFACIFVIGTTPLFYELAVECTYPVPEAVSTLFISLMGSSSMLVFFMIFMIPNMDMRWANWVFVGSVSACVPGLLLYKEKYGRLDIDTGDKEPLAVTGNKGPVAV